MDAETDRDVQGPMFSSALATKREIGGFAQMNAEVTAVFHLQSMQSHAAQFRFRIFGSEDAARDVGSGVAFVVNRNRQRIEIDLAVLQHDLFHRSIFDAARFGGGGAPFSIGVEKFFFVAQTKGQREAFF